MIIHRQQITNNDAARLSKTLVSFSYYENYRNGINRRFIEDSNLEPSGNPVRWCVLNSSTRNGNTVC